MVVKEKPYLLSNLDDLDGLLDTSFAGLNLNEEDRCIEKNTLQGALIVSGILEYFMKNKSKSVSNKDKTEVMLSIHDNYVFAKDTLRKNKSYDSAQQLSDMHVNASINLAGNLYDPNIKNLNKKIVLSNDISLIPTLLIAQQEFDVGVLKDMFFSKITFVDSRPLAQRLQIGYSLNNLEQDVYKDSNSQKIMRFEYGFLLNQLKQLYGEVKENE